MSLQRLRRCDLKRYDYIKIKVRANICFIIIQIQILSLSKKITTLRRASLIIILNEMLIRIMIAIIICVFIVKKKIIESLIVLIVINLRLMSLR